MTAWIQNPANAGLFSLIVLVLVVWSLTWKGLALWKAAQSEEKIWYIVMLILNTVGILEILYLYVFSNRPTADQPRVEKEK